MLSKEMAKIDWENKTPLEINNLVRGLNSTMGPFTFLNDKKIKIWKVQKLSNEEFSNEYEANINVAEKPGTVLLANEKKGLFIKTTDGVLSVLEIQGENAKRRNVSDC